MKDVHIGVALLLVTGGLALIFGGWDFFAGLVAGKAIIAGYLTFLMVKQG